MLNFFGYDGDVPECKFVSSSTVPLVADDIQYGSQTIREWGENLFFEPIPLEMLYTNAERPQIRVKIDGLDAVCPGMNCDYMYVDPNQSVIN